MDFHGGLVGGEPRQTLRQPLDQQSKIMLEREPRQKIRADVPRVVAGDAENDEIKRIGFGRIDLVQKLFRGNDLEPARIARRERHLAAERTKSIKAELRHR